MHDGSGSSYSRERLPGKRGGKGLHLDSIISTMKGKKDMMTMGLLAKSIIMQ